MEITSGPLLIMCSVLLISCVWGILWIAKEEDKPEYPELEDWEKKK